MSLINRQKTATAPAAPGPDVAALQALARTLAPPVDRHDEAERAADCFEQVEALRETVAGTVEAAQQELAAIEAEAARTVNAARAKLQDVQGRAQQVEREAVTVENKGRAYRAAEVAATRAREAWDVSQSLAAERQERVADADALTARLNELEGLQRAAQADLEAARANTDAEAAGEARTRLTGVQEVTPVLVAQRDAATARARAIGTEESGGEYAQALARVSAFLKERDGALDAAEPERVEARRAANPLAALLDDLEQLPPAAREQVLKSWGGAQEQTTTAQFTRTAGGRVTGATRTR